MNQLGDEANQTSSSAERSQQTVLDNVVNSTTVATSVVVMILLVVGIAVDELNFGKIEPNDPFGIAQEFTCGWNAVHDDKYEGGNGRIYYIDACDADSDDLSCDVQSIGEVWLAFGILGICAQALVLLLMCLTVHPIHGKELFLRLAALVISLIACAFVLIQWTVWYAKGCGNYSGDLDLLVLDGSDIGIEKLTFKMGPSMILVVTAWSLGVVATLLQLANTLSVQQRSSGPTKSTAGQGTDLERGDEGSIRS